MLLPFIPPTSLPLPPATIAFTAYDQDGGDTPYTFPALNFGPASASRVIIVGIIPFGNGGVRTITSMTIGGIAATSRFEATNSVVRMAFYTAAVPTGTSGDVVVNLNGPCDAAGCAVWAATNLVSAIPGTTASSIAAPAATTMTIPSAGFGLGYSNSGTLGSIPTATWVGLTENFDDRISVAGSTPGHSGALLAGPAIGQNVTCTWSNTDAAERLAIFATWR